MFCRAATSTSTSGQNVVPIDNKIEQAMVSLPFLIFCGSYFLDQLYCLYQSIIASHHNVFYYPFIISNI